MPTNSITFAVRVLIAPVVATAAFVLAHGSAVAGCGDATDGLGHAACLGAAAETAMRAAPHGLATPVHQLTEPAFAQALRPELPTAVDSAVPLTVVDVAVLRREVRDLSIPEAPSFEASVATISAPAVVEKPGTAYTPFLPAPMRVAHVLPGMPRE